MIVLICGSRNWTNKDLIKQEILGLEGVTKIIHGACRGADYLAGEVATELGLVVVEYPADWNSYGLSAGPRRNQQMLDEGKPDLVLAFTNDFANSKGTKDMVNRAKKQGVTVKIIKEES